MMMRKTILALCVLFALASAQDAGETVPPANNFLVEGKVIIDSKAYNPTNMSLYINSTTTPSYSFNLSAQNFNKNIVLLVQRTVGAEQTNRIFEYTSRHIEITDKRNAYREGSHLMAALLKYNSRKYESQLASDTEPTLLNHTQVIVSYDPESSLMVSRLEDPELFTPQANYYPIADMSKEAKSKAMKINITFTVAARSDAFINSKNHIVSLNEVAAKIKQRIPLVARPIGDTIEPILIYKSLLFNYEAVKKATKTYNQKATSIQSKKYGGLLMPRLHRLPFALLSSIHQTAGKFNITLTDNFVPTFYFILQQGFLLDKINQLQDFLRKSFADVIDQNRDQFEWISLWAEKEVLVGFIVGALWVLLDLNGFINIDKHPGISWSFGYFLIVWLIPQIISLSLRIGCAIHQYWGVGFFILSLVLLKLITTPLQNKFNRHLHKHSTFDKGITEVCFNLLMMAVLANGIFHLFVEKDITNGQLAIWAMSEFQLLLSEYYYFLVMLPPLFLIFKLKSAAHLRGARLLLFLIIALKDDYWILVDTHWALILLRLKEQILFVLIILLKIVYGNRPIEIIKPKIEEVQPEKSSSQEKIEEAAKKDE